VGVKGAIVIAGRIGMDKARASLRIEREMAVVEIASSALRRARNRLAMRAQLAAQ